MKQQALRALGCCLLASVLVGGCGGQSQADPRTRVTNETRSDQGMNSYSGYTAPADDRQFVIDARNNQRGDQIRSAHAVAYELESLPAVQRAAMLVIGRDGYVGVREAQGYQLTDEVRNLIRDKVRGIDPTINRLFITAKPQTVDYLSSYADALERGRPLDAYQARFQEIVKQTWPSGP
jgi:YhcN/YlaJ family sporulation lipoprotein